jgi:hypothetical protein
MNSENDTEGKHSMNRANGDRKMSSTTTHSTAIPDDGLWDQKRTAGFLGVSTRTLFNLKPELPALKIGSQVRYRPADVREYVDRQLQKGLQG